jgi:hypothetical protein
MRTVRTHTRTYIVRTYSRENKKPITRGTTVEYSYVDIVRRANTPGCNDDGEDSSSSTQNIRQVSRLIEQTGSCQ